jgi:hypothetical protein
MPAYSCGDLTPGPHPWDNECHRLRSATGKKQVAGTLLHGCPVPKSALGDQKADPQKSRLNRGPHIGGEPTPIQVEIGEEPIAADARNNGGNASLGAGHESGRVCICMSWDGCVIPYIV